MRVRGAIKVKCHLMFGILVLAVDQIFRLKAFRPAPARPTVTAMPLPAAGNHSVGEFCKRLTSKEDFAKQVRRSMLDVQNDPRTIISFAQKPLLKYAA